MPARYDGADQPIVNQRLQCLQDSVDLLREPRRDVVDHDAEPRSGRTEWDWHEGRMKIAVIHFALQSIPARSGLCNAITFRGRNTLQVT